MAIKPTRFGLSCAITTPMQEGGAVDLPRLAKHARHVLEQPPHARDRPQPIVDMVLIQINAPLGQDHARWNVSCSPVPRRRELRRFKLPSRRNPPLR